MDDGGPVTLSRPGVYTAYLPAPPPPPDPPLVDAPAFATAPTRLGAFRVGRMQLGRSYLSTPRVH